ncbi:MAG: hypothetical protein ACI8RD_008366 [Bacillariaceae sp.]|jgi:hypothetical protein
MAKRKADTDKDKIRPTRFSRRLQEKEEAKRQMVEGEAKITEVSIDLGIEEFNALYSTKKSITIACPEDSHGLNNAELHIKLYATVKNFTFLLANNTAFNKLEKLNFEDVPVADLYLYKILKYCCLPNLRSITIKKNRAKGYFSLSKAFAMTLRPIDTKVEEHLSDKFTYELPRNSVLESISFEPGVKYATIKDLQALNYFVERNRHIKSTNVLSIKSITCNASKREKLVNQLKIDSPEKDFMQATLNILSERHLDKYKAKIGKLAKLVDLKDCHIARSKNLYLFKLKASLLSHTVANASSTGIFDKEVNHSLLYDQLCLNANMLNTKRQYADEANIN